MEINDEYICAMCGQTFRKKWTDEEAAEECVENFGINPLEEPEAVARVCDNCFTAITIGGKPINFN